MNITVKLHQGVTRHITDHLRHFRNSLAKYFPPNNNDSNRLRNPFILSFQMEDFSINEYEQLIDIASDSVLKQRFSINCLSSFGARLIEIFNCAVRKVL